MPVASSQLQELIDIILEEVHPTQMRRILVRFKKTVAYQSNQSFKQTVDRIITRTSEDGR
jgi:hypothetical protein